MVLYLLPVKDGSNDGVPWQLRVVLRSHCKFRIRIETFEILTYLRTGNHSTLRVTDKDKLHVGTSCEAAVDMLDQVRCANVRTGGEVGIRYHRGLQSVTAFSSLSVAAYQDRLLRIVRLLSPG